MQADNNSVNEGSYPQTTRALEEGDIVQLKSGGPKMTIGYSSNGVSDVMWYDSKSATLHKERIFTAALELANK